MKSEKAMSDTILVETGKSNTPTAITVRLEKLLKESRADQAKLKRIIELGRLTRRANRVANGTLKRG